MITIKKYTVIISAWQKSETLENNLIESDNLRCYIQHVLKLEPLQAIGFYNGKSELSFVVHTNRIEVAQGIINHVNTVHFQECGLLSDNAAAKIELIAIHGRTSIGKRFEEFGSVALIEAKKPDNYTILNGTYWQVV